ncbi:hypothetical protein Q9966_001564 [Columba livia]|nr:hypothetical protein Q9966_001564 [Columba livia]
MWVADGEAVAAVEGLQLRAKTRSSINEPATLEQGQHIQRPIYSSEELCLFQVTPLYTFDLFLMTSACSAFVGDCAKQRIVRMRILDFGASVSTDRKAIGKSRAFFSVLLAGMNLNLLNHQGPMLETAFSRAHAGNKEEEEEEEDDISERRGLMHDILPPCVLWSAKRIEIALEKFLSVFVVNVDDSLRERHGTVPVILLVPKHEIQAKWTHIFQILSGQSFQAEKEDKTGKSESYADVLHSEHSESNTLKMDSGEAREQWGFHLQAALAGLPLFPHLAHFNNSLIASIHIMEKFCEKWKVEFDIFNVSPVIRSLRGEELFTPIHRTQTWAQISSNPEFLRCPYLWFGFGLKFSFTGAGTKNGADIHQVCLMTMKNKFSMAIVSFEVPMLPYGRKLVGILIEYQDINRLSIEWLRKKDGPCARELSTGAQKMGNDKTLVLPKTQGYRVWTTSLLSQMKVLKQIALYLSNFMPRHYPSYATWGLLYKHNYTFFPKASSIAMIAMVQDN